MIIWTESVMASESSYNLEMQEIALDQSSYPKRFDKG